MALLKHDAQGFLAGDPIDIGKALSIWDEIRRDVKAIRQAMGGMTSPISSQSTAQSTRSPLDARPTALAAKQAPDRSRLSVVPKAQRAMDVQPMSVLAKLQRETPIEIPRQRDHLGRFVKSSREHQQKDTVSRDADPAIKAVQEVARSSAFTTNNALTTISNQAAKAKEKPASPAGRDQKGRFEKSDKSRTDGQPSSASPDVSSAESRTFLDRLQGVITNTATGTASTLEDADPAIKAVQEVAQPLARGYQMITGGSREDKRKEGWFRKIYASLSGFRKDELAANKLTNKTLKNIEEKPVDGQDGQTGFFGSLLKLIMGIGPMIVAALLALLSKIPVVGPMLAKVFGTGAKAASGVAAGAGKAAGAVGKAVSGVAEEAGVAAKGGGLLKGAGSVAKGFLKKLPFIGSLFGAVGAAADIYGSETDTKLTRKEKDQNAGKATGGLAGTLAGGWAGASAGAAIGALGGPIGIAIGGVVGGAAGMFFGDQAGQVLGETVGGWVGDLRQADIAGHITMAWDSVTGVISGYWTTAMGLWDAAAQSVTSAWDGVITSFTTVSDGIGKAWSDFVALAKTGWDAFTGLFKSAYEGLKSLPVIGTAIQATEDAAKKAATVVTGVAIAAKDKGVAVAGKAADAVVAGTKTAATAVRDGAAWVGKNTTIGKGAVAAYEGVKSAGNWALGKTSQMFESGKGGAGTVSTGKGDFGGASYGTYQLSSKQGKVQDFLKSGKYGDQFAGLQPGTSEFNAKWKDVSKADPEFGNAQHDYIKKTNFDPAAKGLKDAGMDLSGRGAAVQDALWSTSVQFGAGSQKKGNGAIGMFQKALAGKDVAKMSDSDLVTAVQDYKINNNDKLFSSSSESVKKGTAGRAVEEKKRLVALAGQGGGVSDAHVLPNTPEGTVMAASQAASSSPSFAQAPVIPHASALPVQTAFAPAPQVPSFAPPPVIAKAPDVVNPLGSGFDTKKQATAAAPTPDVGQDVRDRRIAHIVTGGFSA